MEQYWVIEAKWGKKESVRDKLLSRGYWYLGYDENVKNQFDQKKRQIQTGDKIAVKDFSQNGNDNPKLKAIGIVKEIDTNKRIICVDWILEEVKRENFGQGEFNSLEGPFFEKEDWVKHLLESI